MGLSEELIKCLATEMLNRMQSMSRTQVIFVGPPMTVLEKLFDAMTNDGSTDWLIEGQKVTVLLVSDDVPSTVTQSTSTRCHWDYALNVRNEFLTTLILTTRKALERIPESIDNALEILGQPRDDLPRSIVATPPWPQLIDAINVVSGVAKPTVKKLMQDIFQDSHALEPSARENYPWTVANAMLSETELPIAAGLPAIGLPFTDERLKLARSSLDRLAKACQRQGFQAVETRLKEVSSEIRDLDSPGNTPLEFTASDEVITDLFVHLRERAGSGANFESAPTYYYGNFAGHVPRWWSALSTPVLGQLLDGLESKQSHGRLRLRVSALISECLPQEPMIVQNEVRIRAVESLSGGHENPIGDVSFDRRYPSASRDWASVAGGQLVDDDVPDHDHTITYHAKRENYQPDRVAIVSLDHFKCKGHARVLRATGNPAPGRSDRREGTFTQEITLPNAGRHDLHVYGAFEVTDVVIMFGNGTERRSSTVEGSYARFSVDLEDEDELDIILLGSGSVELSRWKLNIQVEDARQGSVHSEFELLVRANQKASEKRPIVIPRVSYVRSLESQYLASPESWRGLLGAWDLKESGFGTIDWDSETIGNVSLFESILNVRPSIVSGSPPPSYLEARERIRETLLNSQSLISEYEMSTKAWNILAQDYVFQYLEWLEQEPSKASWSDCIAMFVRSNEHGPLQLTTEPAAVVLSPLHPLRIGWHAEAQRLLKESLSGTPCSLSGLLSSQDSPSILGLPLQRGETIQNRAFITSPCDEPHWLVLINTRDLSKTFVQQEISRVLKHLGIGLRGVMGGITKGQVRQSLDDVIRMLPTRAVLRVGLVGNGSSTGSGAEGVIEWAEERFKSEEPSTGTNLPHRVEVYDRRHQEDLPSAASLASMSERFGDRFLWFHSRSHPVDVRLDLVIFDHVDTSNFELQKSMGPYEPHSVLSTNGLIRLNIRQDSGNGQVIQEARLGASSREPDDRAVLKSAQIKFEQTGNNSEAYLQFEPNGQLLSQWVANSLFLAATSSQLDPAYFIRGVVGTAGYLWDYELPNLGGIDEKGAGYYLISNPPASMETNVEKSLMVVSNPPPSGKSVLREISRRGIPVLKKFIRGGTQSKGEVGMLLAVRLLQDAFRDPNTGSRLPVVDKDTVNLILGVDSYQIPFDHARKALSPGESLQRGDLLVVSIKDGADLASGIRILITPVEVKFHSADNLQILPDAVEQANNLGRLLKKIWIDDPQSDLWDTCSRALLATLLDQAFRVYASKELHHATQSHWTQLHESAIRAVLEGEHLSSIVQVNGGKVLAFGGWPHTRVMDMDGDRVQDTLAMSLLDAQGLLDAERPVPNYVAESIDTLGLSWRDGAQSSGPSNVSSGGDTELSAGEEVDGKEESDQSSAADQGLDGPAVPPEVRARVLDAFDGFIGNEKAVQQVSRNLLVALIEQPPHLSKNFLFLGPPSVGKTEIARRIAAALMLPLVHLDGPSLGSRDHLFDLIDRQLEQSGTGSFAQVGIEAGAPVLEYPPFIVFIDELHLVPRTVQESLLTILEAGDRRVRLSTRIAVVRQGTFLFATTRPSKVDVALRSRCTEIYLRTYTNAQVAEMVQRKMSVEYGVLWEPELYLEISRLGRLIPRVAFDLAEELRKEILVSEYPERKRKEHLEAVRLSKELDENGLRRQELDYLEVLSRAGRPLGEEAVARMLKTVDENEIVDEIEPVLTRINLISLGRGGRELTDAGRRYLASARSRGGV